MEFIPNITKYASFAFELWGFFSSTITLEQSKAVITERLRNREKNFLEMADKCVYRHSKSPYLALLKHAGCEYGDLQNLVTRNGIENALLELYKSGVYISWEEFKGKKKLVRGTSEFELKAVDFDNPYVPAGYQIQSSGTRSAGTRTTFDLRHLAEMSYYRLPTLAVNKSLDLPSLVWKAGLPSNAGIANILQHAKVGKPVMRWFSMASEGSMKTSFVQRLATMYIIYGGRLMGASLPKAEYAGLEDAYKLAKLMETLKREYGSCSMACTVTGAVKICHEAIERAADISGTHFMVSGETLTEVKKRQIEAAGTTVTTRYSTSEIGRIATGCLETPYTDDAHLFHDSTACIQRQKELEKFNVTVNAFLFTNLLSTSPKVLINLEPDDYGILEKKPCNCLLGELGFNYHIRDIRSFSKLTGIGMTILGTDLVKMLEEVLPGKYGGSPVDYQLVEEELHDGQTRLSLLIDPAVGKIDEIDVMDTVVKELRKVEGGKLAAGHWAQDETLYIKRISPFQKAGKVIPLHLVKTK